MDDGAYKRGQTVTAEVIEVSSGGLEVKFGEDDQAMTAFIRKADLSRDRAEQAPDRFKVGDKIDAQVTNVDRVSLSVKALQLAEDKAALEQFGAADSGSSLGDILAAAMREKAKGS